MPSLREALNVCALLAVTTTASVNAMTFEEWQSANFTYEQIWEEGVADPGADPDGDGVANLHEFVFFGNPQAGESALNPVVGVIDNTLTLTYRERHEIADVSISLQGSNTLMNWVTYNNVVEADRETFTDYDEVTLLDPQPFESRRFLRLRTDFTPASTLRAASQLSLKVVTPSSWAINWTDPNSVEIGYAFERKLISTGQWERLGGTDFDTTAWTHALANYQASLTYRVITLGSSQELASTPVSLPDSDGDGIPDALELGASFTGTIGTYATDPNEFSSNESGVSDGWQVANGFDPMGGFVGELDSDGDGVSDAEEARRGTNPHDTDSDDDNIPDGEDGWPLHAWITAPPLPETQYVVIPLNPHGWSYTRFAVGNNLELLTYKPELGTSGKEFHLSLLTQESHEQVTGYSLVNPILHLDKQVEIIQLATPMFLLEGMGGYAYGKSHGLEVARYRLTPDGRYFGGMLEGDGVKAALTDTAGASQLIDFAPNPPHFTSSPNLKSSMAYAVNAQGDVATVEFAGWSDYPATETVAIKNGQNSLSGYLHKTDGTKVQIGDWASVTLTAGGAEYEYSGNYFEPARLNNERIVAGIIRDLKSDSGYQLAIWKDGVVSPLPNQKVMSDLFLSDAKTGIPVVLGGTQQSIFNLLYFSDGVWTDSNFQVWNKETQKTEQLSSARMSNNRMEFLTNAGYRIVRNGRVDSLSKKVPSAWQLYGSSHVNNYGVISSTLKRTIDATGNAIPVNQQVFEPALLYPAGFVIPGKTSIPDRRPLTAFNDSAAKPKVTLAEIELSDISISNGVASVTISGDILDGPMGTIPSGQGGDITEVIVYINGIETHFKGTVTRASQPATFWAPYIDKAVITPFTITFPARDVATIEIETAPNALGLVGRDGFNVIFEETTTAPGTIPGATYSSDLVFSAPLSTTAIDSILLTAPDATTGETLVETSANSKVFVNSTKTASFSLYSTFTDGSPITGPLKGRVSGLSDLPSGSGWSHEDDEGQETALNSQRFRFSVTRLPQPLPQIVSWQADSVTMHDRHQEPVLAPIAFAAAPVSSLNLNFQGQEFSLEKLTGHPDQDSAFAITATGKPLLGFIATREADPENTATDIVREFVYYDHSSTTLVRQELDYTNGELEWSLELGDTNPIEITHKTPIKRIRVINSAGTELPGYLPIEIENILAFLDGENGVTIEDGAAFYLELSGYSTGEVVRVFSTEATDDHFDLVIPGDEPLIEPNPTKHTVLNAVSSGVYRTTEKVIVYSTPTNAAQRLSTSDWADLKALGYVAIHNEDFVIKTGEDLVRWLAENNLTDIHPPANAVLGITNNAGTIDASMLRFEGFEDHHVFNAWHKNEQKAARWNKIFGSGWKKVFGDDFDVDEFTVPVHKKTHKKITSAITNRWESFLDEYFDIDGNIKPGVNIPDLRVKTMDKMYSICDEFQIDTSKMRIWPTVLKNRAPTDTLYKRLVSSQGQLGSSLNKLTQIKQSAYRFASSATKAAARQRSVTEVKALAKRVGKSRALKLVPFVGIALTAATTANAAVDYNVLGWEEALAQQINTELGLDDIELAREFVNAKFSGSYIAGGTPRLSISVNSTQILTLGHRTFTCGWLNGQITSVIPYSVVEIKEFPDGTKRVALVREDSPDQVEYLDNPGWMIDNYWPAVGDSQSLYNEAMLDARSKK